MRRGFAAVVVVAALGFLLLGPGRAQGHAALVRSDPAENAFIQASPAAIQLTFTETVDGRSSSIRLLDAAGRAVATGAAELSADRYTFRVTVQALPAGIYNVIWQNVSTVDGHGYRGSYPFTVLNADGSLPNELNTVSGFGTEADPPPQAEGVAVRALSLLGLVLVAAAALLLLLLPREPEKVRSGLVVCAAVGAAVLAIATVMNFQLTRETYPDRTFASIVTDTRAGSYLLVRIGSVLVLGVAISAFRDSPRVGSTGALLGTLGYLWAYSATSHAAAGAGSGWAIVVDMIHGIAAVAWIGAVVGVALSARLSGREPIYERLMPRFGLFASTMVFLLIGSGFLNSLAQLDSFDRLWTTRYGVTLLVKLGLMAPLLAMGLYNARWGRRRLETMAAGEPRRFLRTVTAEIVLGGLVFASAAALTQTTVAKSVFDRPESRPYDRTSPANDIVARLQIDPNRTGLNSYAVTLTRGDGSAVLAERVRLTFRYRDDQTIGASNLTLAAGTKPGRFVGQGPFLTLEGQWTVEAEVRRANANDVKAFFDVRPAGTAVGIVRVGSRWDNPAPGLTWNQYAGIVSLLLGLGMALFRRPIARLGKPFTWFAEGGTLLGFGVGAMLLFGVHREAGTGDLKTNPIFPDQNSITQGRTLYQKNCLTCHGRNGVPPRGLDLNPYPLDLTVHIPQHPDGTIFNFIDRGVEGSAMRAWGEGEGELSETEMWHLVNFLRTLGATTE